MATKPMWKSKTAWFGVMVALIPVLTELQKLQLPGWAPVLIGAAIVLLRAVTTQAVTLKPVTDDLSNILLKGLCIMACVAFVAGCSTVTRTVGAGQSVECVIKPAAPFYVKCDIDGEQVFDLSGPQELPMQCEGASDGD